MMSMTSVLHREDTVTQVRIRRYPSGPGGTGNGDPWSTNSLGDTCVEAGQVPGIDGVEDLRVLRAMRVVHGILT